jgi:hypothetical protein
LSIPSTVALPSATFTRRFRPFAAMTRIRSATGLKSTATPTPAGSASDSWLTFSQAPVFTSTVTMAPSGARP